MHDTADTRSHGRHQVPRKGGGRGAQDWGEVEGWKEGGRGMGGRALRLWKEGRTH